MSWRFKAGSPSRPSANPDPPSASAATYSLNRPAFFDPLALLWERLYNRHILHTNEGFMPSAKLLAGCLLLGLVACKHPSGANESTTNLYETDDPNGVLPLNPNVEVNTDMPDIPVRQAWAEGGRALEVHRSASCPTDSVEDNGCGNETSYRFIRSSRELQLSACRCNPERIEKKVILSQSQAQELDKFIVSLELSNGPQVTCPADTAATDWELIVESAEAVPQSFPVALCGSSNTRQTGKINERSFQALYEYLKKSLPE
jgi:hypothetical protein